MSKSRDRRLRSAPIRILSVILVIFYLSDLCAADNLSPRQSVKEDFRTLRSKIEREQKRLDLVKEKQKSVEDALRRVNSDYEQAVREREGLTKLIKSIDDKEAEIEVEIADTRETIEVQSLGLRKRLIGIYKMYRRTSVLDYVFRAASSADLLKRAYFLTAVASHDHSYLNRLHGFVGELERQEKKLSALAGLQKKHLAQAAVLEKKLERQRVEKAELVREAKIQSESLEKTVGKLTVSAGKLEGALSRIMGGAEEVRRLKQEAREVVPLMRERKEEKPSLDVPLFTAGVPPFQGTGLTALRGALPFPVQGKVLQRFGKVRHEEFADMLFVKGLEFTAPVGEKVKAVATGRVVFSQVLPGYGNVVILDHGERYYTLYGRLAGSLCRLGEVVRKGDVLAVLGEADRRGRNFYFELRLGGQAVDPTGFFARAPEFVKTS